MRKHLYTVMQILFLFIAFFITSDIMAKKAKKSTEIVKIDTIRVVENPVEKYPVIPFIDTIFYIYGNVGAFTPSQRAAAIEEKVRLLYEDNKFEADSFKFVDYSGYFNLMYKGDIILSVDSLQASILNKSRVQIANEYTTKIIESINKEKDRTSWKHILLQVLGVVAILVIEYFIFRLLKYVFRRLRAYFRLQKRTHKIKGIFSNLLDPDKALAFAFALLQIAKFFFALIFIYLGVYAMFKLFPTTEELSDKLLSYILIPFKSIVKSVIDYTPNLFTILVIVFIFAYIRKFLRLIAEKIAEGKIVFKGFYADWAIPSYNILNVILLIFMFILIFPHLPKSDSQAFQGVSVFAGLMLSLGSTSIIGNLVAGLVITYMRPFKIGDRIKMGDVTGNVIEKTPLVTRIKTPKNELITIPNSNVMSAHTINYSQSAREYGLILYDNFTIGYEVPWQKVHELLLEVANRTDNVSKKLKPFILQDSLSDFYIEYQLNVYIKDANLMPKIYSDLRQNAQSVFAEADIELLSPHYRINREDNSSTVPPISHSEKKS